MLGDTLRALSTRALAWLREFEISNLKLRSEAVSRQLRTWTDYLQNSEIRGQRYLTSKGKRVSKEAREREEFLKELEEVRNRKPSG